MTAEQHAALLERTADAKAACDATWHAVRTIGEGDDEFNERLADWRVAHARYTAFNEAGLIITLGYVREDTDEEPRRDS